MRFSVRDYEEIKRKAEYAGMNFTQFVTAASLGKRIAVIDGLGQGAEGAERYRTESESAYRAV